MPEPLQRATRVRTRRVSSAHSRASRASDTPVASPFHRGCAFARAGFVGAAEITQPTLREDEAECVDPRCLPSSGDIRALARTVADLECGHVMGFRFDPVLDALSPPARVALSRSLVSRGLDSRPRTLPRSGEMVSARFSESDAACRLLQTDLRRAGTLLERPILARLECTGLLEPCTLRVCPRLPRAPLEERGTREPTSLEVSGQRAT